MILLLQSLDQSETYVTVVKPQITSYDILTWAESFTPDDENDFLLVTFDNDNNQIDAQTCSSIMIGEDQ